MPLVRKTLAYSPHYNINNKEVRMVLEPRGYGYYEPYYELTGFSLTDLEIEELAATMSFEPVIKNGVHYNQERQLIPALPKRYTQTIGFPPGKWLRTVLSPYVKPGSRCLANVWVVPTCTDDCGGWWFFYPESSLNYLTHENLIEVGEDGTVVAASTNIVTQEVQMGLALEANYIRNYGQNLHAVALRNLECAECDEQGAASDGAFGGVGPALAVPPLETTEDGFLTDTAIVMAAIAADMYVTDIYYGENIVIFTYADDPSATVGVVGGVGYSIDGGAAVDTGLTDAMYGVTYAEGYYVAVGINGGVYRSLDGVTWNQVVAGVTTADLTGIATDEFDQTAYISGIDAGADAAFMYYDGLLTDISGDLPGGGTGLISVGVLGPGHIMFGEVGGNVYENAYYPEDPTFRTVLTVAAAPYVVGLGDRSRQIVAMDDTLYIRDILTGREWVTITVPTATGNILDGAMARDSDEIFEGPNYFVFVTEDGDIFRLEPCQY